MYIGARRRVKEESQWLCEYLKAESTGASPPEMPDGYDGGRTFLILLLLGPLGENMLSLKVFCTGSRGGAGARKTKAEKRALQGRDTQRTLTAVAAGRGGAGSFLRTDRPVDSHDKLVLQTMVPIQTPHPARTRPDSPGTPPGTPTDLTPHPHHTTPVCLICFLNEHFE